MQRAGYEGDTDESLIAAIFRTGTTPPWKPVRGFSFHKWPVGFFSRYVAYSFWGASLKLRLNNDILAIITDRKKKKKQPMVTLMVSFSCDHFPARGVSVFYLLSSIQTLPFYDMEI